MLLLCLIYLSGGSEKVDLQFIKDADFYSPVAIRIDASNRIYVVDSKDHHVLVFDNTGKPIMTLGQKGQGPGEFNNPADVAFLKDGRIVVADGGQQRLHIFSVDGVFQKMIQIKEQPVGQLLALPDGNLLLTKSGAGSFNIKLGEEAIERFGIFNSEGKRVALLGTAEHHENPLLSIMLNAGDLGVLNGNVVQASTVKNELLTFNGPNATSVKYPIRFEPVEPTANMKEEKQADGSTSVQMSVDMDIVCVAMAPCSKDELLILRNMNGDGDPLAQLVRLYLKGEVVKIWKQKFKPIALGVDKDGKYAYILNDLEEDIVVSRVAL